MTLDHDACYRALVSRDARFDGSFFVGVRTTGIYCRPVCPARTPREERCVFFPRAALAEQAGFRACFRCRPERAPGSAKIDALSALVARATRRIDDGDLNRGSVEDLASALGTSSRHLRRAMNDELGASPLELALSRRIALARALLLDTTLPITDVAFASGFSSLRRFNDAYRASQGMTPTDVRAKRRSSEEVRAFRVMLDVRPPFDPEPALEFLRARTVEGSEVIADGTYVRATAIDGKAGLVAITPIDSKLVVEVSAPLAPALMTIASRVRRLFDTDADVKSIGAHLAKDRMLAARVKKRPALRVMGAFDAFEWATRAVLGQQISVRGALTIASRLVKRFGVAIPDPRQADSRSLHAWPSAERLADAREADIRTIGLTAARARTLRGLAVAVAEKKLVLDRMADPDATMQALLALPGIGPWTAQYIGMRALGWPDAFPSGDLGLRKALGGISDRACLELAEKWRPWRAYAAAHLWMDPAQ